MERKSIKFLKIIIVLFLLLLFTLFLIRAFSPREIDDVSPEITCEKGLLEKSDILWVIPKFENKSISEDKGWCKEILNLNKTIGLHGITHEFEEFNKERNQEYFSEGIKIFEDCFGYTPTMFKPPQLKITRENKELIKKNNLSLKLEFNQWTHKVYHCGEYGEKRDWLIDLF